MTRVTEDYIRLDNPSTAVVIVNWNGRHHLENCLDALSKQSLPPSDIIVVDNASTDGSIDYLATWPSVRVVSLDTNLGFAGGNAAGLQATQCEYIVLLNNDTRPRPDWLERLVHAANGDQEAGIVGSLLVDWEGRYIDTAGDACVVTGKGKKLQSGEAVANVLPSRRVFSVCAGAALYKRAMIDEVGFLDTRFFMNSEDTDLAFRAQLMGWKVLFCAEAVVHHRISGSQGARSDHAVFYSTRNHMWLYAKCMPTRLILKFSGQLIAYSLVSFMYHLAIGRVAPHVRGYFAAMSGLTHVLRDRRFVQSTRRVPVGEIDSQLLPLSTALRQLLGEVRTRRA